MARKNELGCGAPVKVKVIGVNGANGYDVKYRCGHTGTDGYTVLCKECGSFARECESFLEARHMQDRYSYEAEQ